MSNLRKHMCQLKNTSKYAPRPGKLTQIRQHIRMFTTISTNHPETKLLFRKSTSEDAERSRHINSHLWFSIHPYSMCCYYWRIMMALIYFLVISCDLINVALYNQILMDNPGSTWLLYYTGSVTVLNSICVVDIIMNFLTGYIGTDVSTTSAAYIYSPEMQHQQLQIVVLEKRKIAYHYLKTFLLIDSLAFIYLVFRIFTFINFNFRAAYIRLLRFIRFYTVIQTAKMITVEIFQHQYFFLILCASFALIYCIFIFACLRLAVPQIIALFTGENRVTAAKIYNQLGMHADSRIIFWHALYDSIRNTVFSNIVNYSNGLQESLFLFVNSITCFHLRAWWMAALIMFMDAKFSSWLVYERFKNDVHHFLKSTDISKTGLRDVMVYLENTLHSEMFCEKEIFNSLERRLQFELFTRSSMDLVRNCHLFWDLSNKIISLLASRLKYETYAKGELLLKTGEHANCMYFIASGTVAIYNRRGRELCHLSDGDYFGEIGLLNTRSGRTADVIVLEQSTVYRLDVKDFHAVIKPKSKLYRSLLKGSIVRSLKRSIVLSKTTFFAPLED